MIQNALDLPRSADELTQRSHAFRKLLALSKQTPPHAEFSWYPYDTMASLQHMAPLLTRHFDAFQRALNSGPALDVGCGDGDLSFFLASFGVNVTAIDNLPTNYNWMTGIRALRDRLGMPVDIFERDIDSQFHLPGNSYGFTLLLGILYHLKNPFYVLETLANRSRYCVFSTRVAAVTPAGTLIRDEPVGYLLDRAETNADASNYWIFSPAGLLRLARRSGWNVIDHILVGCTDMPNPVDADKDGRMFVFLRSRLRSAPATIALREGWTGRSQQNWAWTLKKFSFDVQFADPVLPPRFELGFTIPEVVASVSAVSLRCQVSGQAIATHDYSGPGEHTFSATLPRALDPRKPLRFEFAVDHSFKPAAPDPRELGIIVNFRNLVQGITEPIPLWFE